MKIQSISKRRLRELILSLGFEEEEGKHHVFFYFRYKGKIYVRTKYLTAAARMYLNPF